MDFIDIDFDFPEDSLCGDPDTDSIRLYENHKFLWNGKLPSEKNFDFEIIKIGGKFGRTVLRNKLLSNLSSDRICPHFDGRYKVNIDEWISSEEKEQFKSLVRTIGGHIIFPAHKNKGFTINQARGINRKICDRFDLTLECIRRFYQNDNSPLFDTLKKYEDFFMIFGNFKNYIDFFLLQDFVDEYYNINFSLPFDDFSRSPLPQNITEYQNYRNHTTFLINARNQRIFQNVKEMAIINRQQQ